MMLKVAAIRSYSALTLMDSTRVWPRCRWAHMYDVAWSTKTVAAQKRSEVKKPDICMIIPWVLEVNASSDVLSPAAVSDSLLITCFYFPFTLQGFFCTHQNMHDTQIGGCQDASLESKMPIDAITCIYLIGTQWFVLSWISSNLICTWVRVSGVIALMISYTSFGFLSR